MFNRDFRGGVSSEFDFSSYVVVRSGVRDDFSNKYESGVGIVFFFF